MRNSAISLRVQIYEESGEGKLFVRFPFVDGCQRLMRARLAALVVRILFVHITNCELDKRITLLYNFESLHSGVYWFVNTFCATRALSKSSLKRDGFSIM